MDNCEPLKKIIPSVKICERCGCSFDCNAADIKNCACSKIKVTDKETAYIKARCKDCICMKCIGEIILLTSA